jgi:hypothetical protein
VKAPGYKNKASEAVRKALGGKEPKQVIVVRGKLVNIVL